MLTSCCFCLSNHAESSSSEASDGCSGLPVIAVSAALLAVIVVLIVVAVVQCVLLWKMKRSGDKTAACGTGTSGAPMSSNEAYTVDKLVDQGDYERVSPSEAYAMTKKI